MGKLGRRPWGARAWLYIFFFFNDTATTEIYTLSLHDALPISLFLDRRQVPRVQAEFLRLEHAAHELGLDRKSTRLNSSHGYISYAVFCLKKKKYRQRHTAPRHNGNPT